MKLSNLLLLFLPAALLLLVSTFTISAAPPEVTGEMHLYVDAGSGDDALAGTSPETALRSLLEARRRMDTVPVEHRVILHLARGSVWREDLAATDIHDYMRQLRALPRANLTIRPYGEGEKPTISGLDLMPHDQFEQPDAENLPHVWTIRVAPPDTHGISYGQVLGVIADGKQPLRYISVVQEVEDTSGKPTFIGGRGGRAAQVHRGAAAGQSGGEEFLVDTVEEAIARVNEIPGSFHARDNGDGTWDYFVNSGSDPTKDGSTYEFKVRNSVLRPAPWNRWENIRFIGLNGRNGISAAGPDFWMDMEDVEILYGAVHNALLQGYRFTNMLSVGYFDSTAFHAHSPRGPDIAYGSLYDRCTARDSMIGFYDHTKKNRPWIYLRDVLTENVRSIIGHGSSTQSSYIIGHRHNPEPTKDGKLTWPGDLGGLVTGENYIEDSVFRFVGGQTGGWHPVYSGLLHMRMRNSVIYQTVDPTSSRPSAISLIALNEAMQPVDLVYDHATLILDFGGEPINTAHPAATHILGQISAETRGTITFRNSVIAVINAPNMKPDPEGQGVAMEWLNDSEAFEIIFDNCVLTYVEPKGRFTGVEGEDYVIADAVDIFAGDVSAGDFRLKADGIAVRMDAGYREGREPVYRLVADGLVEELPTIQDSNGAANNTP